MSTPDAPTTLLEFQRRFGDEEACQAYLEAWRWPKGFVCPRCSGKKSWRLARRRMLQCAACRHQVSVTAGTALHRTKLPLRMWFWAVFLVARHKKSVSALQLQADLDLGCYETAWGLLHKIRACFDESGDFPLRGLVEADEAYVGNGSGKDGRGDRDKGLIVAAVERHGDGTLGSARMEAVPNASGATLIPFLKRSVDLDAVLETDGWSAYQHLKDHGWRRHVVRQSTQRDGSFRAVLPAVHLLFSNFKTWIRGRFHGVSRSYLHAYLAEFVYRFNRRHSPPALFAWVTRRLVQRPHLSLAGIQAEATR